MLFSPWVLASKNQGHEPPAARLRGTFVRLPTQITTYLLTRNQQAAYLLGMEHGHEIPKSFRVGHPLKRRTQGGPLKPKHNLYNFPLVFFRESPTSKQIVNQIMMLAHFKGQPDVAIKYLLMLSMLSCGFCRVVDF